MKWVAVLKSDQFVHRVVGYFTSEKDAEQWIATQENLGWYSCELEELIIL